MRHWYEKLGAISKQIALTSVLFVGCAEVGHAYTLDAKYKCKDANGKLMTDDNGLPLEGYYTAVTDPADIPDGSNIQPAIRELPSNVCVRQRKKYNFAPEDFIKIKAGILEPFPGVKFSASKYEPIVGHYLALGKDYVSSTTASSPSYMNFTGAHPVLVRKQAYAAIKYKAGRYLIDKQTIAAGMPSCPSTYSTLGNSSSCYSKTNQLRFGAANKLSLGYLSEFTPEEQSPGQECPLGFAMANGLGSNRGICTPIRAFRNKAVQQLWVGGSLPSNVVCPGGEAASPHFSPVCVPVVTLVYCGADHEELVYFNTNRYVEYLGQPELSETWFDRYASRVVIGKISLSHILNAFNSAHPLADPLPIIPSTLDSGSVPVFKMFSETSCDTIRRVAGFALEPFPSSW